MTFIHRMHTILFQVILVQQNVLKSFYIINDSFPCILKEHIRTSFYYSKKLPIYIIYLSTTKKSETHSDRQPIAK